MTMTHERSSDDRHRGSTRSTSRSRSRRWSAELEELARAAPASRRRCPASARARCRSTWCASTSPRPSSRSSSRRSSRGSTREAMDEARLDPVDAAARCATCASRPGQPLTFEAVVDVRPRGRGEGLQGAASAPAPCARWTDAAVDARPRTSCARSRRCSSTSTGPAERGDVRAARLDPAGRERPPAGRVPGQEPAHRARGAGLLPDLENGLLGADGRPGAHGRRALTRPTTRRRSWRARRCATCVKVRKIQEKKLRDLDDNFARERVPAANRSRSCARGSGRTSKARSASACSASWRRAITEELVQRNPFELPERLVRVDAATG